MGKQIAWDEIDKKAKEILDASDEIWGCAETAFQEDNSVKVLCDLLKKEGFAVEENLADVKTAFKGTYGSGKPVIGILGEFDALSGLNQEPCATEKRQWLTVLRDTAAVTICWEPHPFPQRSV